MKNIVLICALLILGITAFSFITPETAQQDEAYETSPTEKSINQNQVSALFVATNKGLVISYNKGRTWIKHNSFQISSKDPVGMYEDYNNIRSIYYYKGKIYSGSKRRLDVSSDNGKTWRGVDYVYDIYTRGMGRYDLFETCPPEIFNIYAHNGIIYASSGKGVLISYNNGETWLSDGKLYVEGPMINNRVDEDDLIYSYSVFANDKRLYVGQHSSLYIKDLEDKTKSKVLNTTSCKELHCYNLKGPHSLNYENSQVYDVFVRNRLIYIARPCGVMISDDEGETWEKHHGKEIENAPMEVSDIYVDENDVIYASSSSPNGEGFLSVSENGGKTWKKYLYDTPCVTKSLYSKKMHVIDRNNIYVATNKGLYYTGDGGETWDKYDSTNGLPCDDVNDVFIQMDYPFHTLDTALKEIVVFPDATLEQAIRKALNKHEGDIYKSDLLRLTVLEAEHITDITGLEYCKNLEDLSITNGKVSNISPLTALKKLRRLNLSSNYGLNDISVLSNLTNLTHLNLSFNRINDISGLANFTKLKQLDIANNHGLEDFSVLSKLNQLEILNLAESGIDNDDLSAIVDLISLKELYLIHCREVNNLNALSKLTNLTTLDLSYNKNIVDFSILSKLNNLIALILIGTNINNNDLLLISKITELRKLNLAYCRGINDLNALSKLINSISKLTNLEELNLHFNQIKDISALKKSLEN